MTDQATGSDGKRPGYRKVNPFRPGFGKDVPLIEGRLPGRDGEMDALRAAWAEASDQQRSCWRVVFGPRGVGKTNLVYHYAEELRNGMSSRNGRVGKVWPDAGIGLLGGANMAGLESLVTHVEMLTGAWGVAGKTLHMYRAWRQRRREGGRGVSASEISRTVGEVAKLLRNRGDTRESIQRRFDNLPNLLRVAAASRDGKPFTLLIDEAHKIPREVLYYVANLIQDTGGGGGETPLLVVLAGTPDLIDRLVECEATFVMRGPGIQLPVDLLENPDAAEAIGGPLAEDDIDMPDNLLANAVDEAGGYPYFVQLWGKALWDVAKENGWRIDEAAFTEAGEQVADWRDAHYIKTAEYIGEVGSRVFDAAAAVARLYPSDGSQPEREIPRSLLVGAIGQALGKQDIDDTVTDTLKTLVHAGFVWQPKETRDHYVAGIPTMMSHVVMEAKKAAANRGASL